MSRDDAAIAGMERKTGLSVPSNRIGRLSRVTNEAFSGTGQSIPRTVEERREDGRRHNRLHRPMNFLTWSSKVFSISPLSLFL